MVQLFKAGNDYNTPMTFEEAISRLLNKEGVVFAINPEMPFDWGETLSIRKSTDLGYVVVSADEEMLAVYRTPYMALAFVIMAIETIKEM